MFDLLITGSLIVDGSGATPRRADIGVSGGIIEDVGKLTGRRAAKHLEADGLAVSPGFVDMHAHSDLALLIDPLHEAKVCQGVTLEVIGQDGLGYAPADEETLHDVADRIAGWNGQPDLSWAWRTLDDYLCALDETAPVNVACLAPHGTLRLMAVGTDDRAASASELEEMRMLLDDALLDGAFGLSTGLTYAPGRYASDDEIISLCDVMRGRGGYYCPHHRGYGRQAMDEYDACITIAERAGVPLHIAHCHLSFTPNCGRAPELLGRIDAALAAGVDVTLDSYPYTAGSTQLAAYLPSWMHAGGRGRTIERLADMSLRETLRQEMEESGSDGFHGMPIDWGIVVVSAVNSPDLEALVGSTIAEAARATGEPPFDLFCRVLLTDELRTTCISHFGDEDNVRAIMQHPHHCAGSDGILVGERPHPRGWGTMPRYLGRYARDEGLFSLQEIVRKLTSLPARRLGLRDRGVVAEGYAADLVCFDPDAVLDIATYDDPKRRPVGVHHVFVNGRAVVADGVPTGERAGRALRGASYDPRAPRSVPLR
jgi:N-acyl-D-amino-acid deacylase